MDIGDGEGVVGKVAESGRDFLLEVVRDEARGGEERGRWWSELALELV